MGHEYYAERIWDHFCDPRALLIALGFHGSISRRKLRLFGCAAAQMLVPSLPTSSRAGVEVAERYADGRATGRQLAAARRAALENALGQEWTVWRRIWNGEECRWATWDRRLGVAAWTTLAKQEPMTRHEWCEGDDPRAEALLLREIFGNPFDPISIEASQLTPTVVSLALAIYTERAFDRLAILADALEDAGCTNQEILAHCRGPGPHVRGCWVVDLLLGKE